LKLALLSLSLLAALRVVAAQTPDGIAEGEKLYAARCAGCHGKDLRGGEGPNLFRSRIVTGSADQKFYDVIRKGIPGTEMVAMPLTDQQTWQIVRFVHSITKPGQGPPVPGDVAAGRKVFAAARCGRCHIVEGKGGVIGPDLSSVALRLSSAQIREALRHARSSEGFQQVMVKTLTDGSVEGMLKNQDNFSLQIMTLQGDLVSLPRREVMSLRFESAIKTAADGVNSLGTEDMQNLLAYLDRQRAPFLHHDIGFQTY